MIVVAAVIIENGKLLLCHRNAKQIGWEFPGGKVDKGETEPQALQREILEELQLQIVVGRFCAESQIQAGDKIICLRAYYAAIIGGTLALNVHDQAVWIEPEEVLQHALLPADIPIAQAVLQNYKNV
ncbi:MAG: (deoxy)nucleoside triphosphate pyrophosphohydrolase [Eubacteriales bacterium]|nr:(deoxy)nucleoside triphosphate pyrophosphohydrolase [Eubacteriales bacterium]